MDRRIDGDDWGLYVTPRQRDTSFTAQAVHALRLHRWCGDTYTDDGWPEVAAALARYALERRRARAHDDLMRWYRSVCAGSIADEEGEHGNDK